MIADDTADPEFIAADLLSQAEHGPDSQVILVTPSQNIADRTAAAIERQLTQLSRANIAQQALTSSLLIVTETILQCVAISNQYYQST